MPIGWRSQELFGSCTVRRAWERNFLEFLFQRQTMLDCWSSIISIKKTCFAKESVVRRHCLERCSIQHSTGEHGARALPRRLRPHAAHGPALWAANADHEHPRCDLCHPCCPTPFGRLQHHRAVHLGYAQRVLFFLKWAWVSLLLGPWVGLSVIGQHSEFNVEMLFHVFPRTIGSNGADFPPQVPKLHRWIDEGTQKDILVAYHPYGYGGYGLKDWAWSAAPRGLHVVVTNSELTCPPLRCCYPSGMILFSLDNHILTWAKNLDGHDGPTIWKQHLAQQLMSFATCRTVLKRPTASLCAPSFARTTPDHPPTSQRSLVSWIVCGKNTQVQRCWPPPSMLSLRMCSQ